jgi:hypothetical protein
MFEEECCDFICNHATLDGSTLDGSTREAGDSSAFFHLLYRLFRFPLSLLSWHHADKQLSKD